MLPFKYNDVRQVRISKTILEAEALPLRIINRKGDLYYFSCFLSFFYVVLSNKYIN